MEHSATYHGSNRSSANRRSGSPPPFTGVALTPQSFNLNPVNLLTAFSAVLLLLAVSLFSTATRAEEIPPELTESFSSTTLTDTISGSQGTGSIDLMKDVTGSELESAIDDGTLYLGIDLNEHSVDPESALSQGLAIKEVEMIITTTEGTFTYTTFYTNTTAMLLEEGATESQEYQTLFGQTGSNELTSSSDGFDLSTFDDVIEIRDIDYTGEIIDAQINITFLDTANTGEANEEFFDYSAGFEDLALLSSTDAQSLDNENIGLTNSPTGVTYTTSTPSGGTLSEPSGAPLPPWILLLALPTLLLLRSKGKSNPLRCATQ